MPFTWGRAQVLTSKFFIGVQNIITRPSWVKSHLKERDGAFINCLVKFYTSYSSYRQNFSCRYSGDMALTDDRPSARTGMIKHTSTTWRLKGSFYDKSAQSIFNFFSLLPNTYRKCHSSCHYVVQGVIIMISILICHLTRVNNKVCTVLLHIKQWGIDEKKETLQTSRNMPEPGR